MHSSESGFGEPLPVKLRQLTVKIVRRAPPTRPEGFTQNTAINKIRQKT